MIIIAKREGTARKYIVAAEAGPPSMQMGRIIDLDLQEASPEELLVQSIIARGYWDDPGTVTDDERADLIRLSGYID